EAATFQRRRHVSCDGAVVLQLDTTVDKADLAPQPPDPPVVRSCRIGPLATNRTGMRQVPQRQAVGQGRFTCSGPTDDAVQRTGGDLEAHVVQGTHWWRPALGRRIGLTDIVYGDHEYSRVGRTGRTRKRDRQHALTVRRPSSMTLRRVSIRDRYISTSIGTGVIT